MDNNRTIIAVALIILLWSGYSLFFPPQPPPAEQNVTAEAVAEKPQESSFSAVSEARYSSVVDQEFKSAVYDNFEEKLITVSSDFYDIKLSTKGATVRSVALKKYKEDNTDDAKPYQLIDLSVEKAAIFKTSGSEGLFIPEDLPFNLVGDVSDIVFVDSDRKTVSFQAVTASGLTFIKNYTFYNNSYQIDIDVELINDGENSIKGLFNLSLVTVLPGEDDKGLENMYTFIGPLSFDGEDLIEDDIDDLEKSAKIYGDGIIWSGYVSKYFLTIVNPQSSAKKIQIEYDDGVVQNKFISPFISLYPGQKTILKYVSFLGPIDYDLLQSVGYQFEQAKDYGFFSILAKPLMHTLKFFYGYIGNNGFAIILLTICIKLIFWPLTQKSYKSMKGMQKLQPEMQKLREKHGKDKQKLNQEMMTFYKENKVNPMGGCLPMLIQIPVFFALYQVLLGAIELRHAPFMLWITDLSIKDPYYITPVIMGATMFIQQKMTPTNMDPTQAKVMLMMPVVFTFLFLNFPAGLVVYWLINNLLTILQQYLIRRQPD
ncbi:MAG: membrane protein insertase YidC [Desulfuromonadales bacterium]|nr:membrane protein insertase YidC [Desulfuromonadales bacterium]